jgi:hypothetical protein
MQAGAQPTPDYEALLAALKAQFGAVTVPTVLLALAQTRHGLTAGELEDVLSLADDCLNEVYTRLEVVPTVRRFPVRELTALLRALAPWLALPVTVDGTKDVLGLKPAAAAAVQRLLASPSATRQASELLADFFQGRWAGERAKPFENTPALMRRFTLPVGGEAIRHVALQPHVFPAAATSAGSAANGRVVRNGIEYNARKVNELPLHLRGAERWAELVELCLANYEFLLAKMSVAPAAEVLADFNVELPEATGQVFAPLTAALTAAMDVLEDDPYQVTGQLAARLLPPADATGVAAAAALTGMAAIVFEAARLRGGVRDIALTPRFAQFPSPDSPLAVVCGPHGHTAPVHALAAAGPLLLSAGDDRLVQAWTVAGPLRCRGSRAVSADWLRALAVTPDGREAVVGSWDATLTVLRLSAAGDAAAAGGPLLLEPVSTLVGHSSYVNAVAITADGKRAVVRGRPAAGALPPNHPTTTHLTLWPPRARRRRRRTRRPLPGT